MLDQIFGFCKKTKCLTEVYSKKEVDEIVGNLEVKNNGITTEKIANGAVTGEKIADATITKAKLAENSVTGTKIMDRSIQASHISTGAVYEVGNYIGIGAGEEKTIDIGFKPSFLIIIGGNGWKAFVSKINEEAALYTYQGYDEELNEHNSGGWTDYECLTENGFKVITSEMNKENETYCYIAFR